MTSAGSRAGRSRGWLFPIVLTSLLLAGCNSQTAPVQLSGATMGTTWHLTYVAPVDAPEPETVQAAIQAVLDAVEQSMSTYREDSEISRLNRAPPGTWFEISGDFYRVLSAALAVGRHSGGAYDVTLGPLVNLWGFGPEPFSGAPPSQDAITREMARIGQHRLRLDGDVPAVRKLAPVSLDLSSIAKGFAVDRVAAGLREQGIHRFLVEVGGEMLVSGLSHRGDAWRVAIERPESSGRSVATAIALTDNAVATSGDYRNFFELEGRRYSHTIDPRSGYPVAHDLVSVTVVHPSAMLADAWATALTVLGAEDAMAVAQEQGLAVYFIQRNGETLQHSHTAEFSPYLVVEDQQGMVARE
jgi:thiamine biosynthesis lipoprotein